MGECQSSQRGVNILESHTLSVDGRDSGWLPGGEMLNSKFWIRPPMPGHSPHSGIFSPLHPWLLNLHCRNATCRWIPASGPLQRHLPSSNFHLPASASVHQPNPVHLFHPGEEAPEPVNHQPTGGVSAHAGSTLLCAWPTQHHLFCLEPKSIGLLICPCKEITCSLRIEAISWFLVSGSLKQPHTWCGHLLNVPWAGFRWKGENRLF